LEDAAHKFKKILEAFLIKKPENLFLKNNLFNEITFIISRQKILEAQLI